ncbi:Uncharacterised protein [Mycobacteroides abscessus]|nr:Uncharacterised protein [Mycobacteroides abscessus]
MPGERLDVNAEQDGADLALAVVRGDGVDVRLDGLSAEVLRRGRDEVVRQRHVAVAVHLDVDVDVDGLEVGGIHDSVFLNGGRFRQLLADRL